MRARAEALDQDHSAIRRRLNLVREELNQVQNEKEAKHQMYLEVANETDKLNLQLKQETDLDVQNQKLNIEIDATKKEGKALHE